MADRRSIFRSRRMAVVFMLGFSSGLPLFLVGQTLQQWAYDAHLDIKKLSMFVLIKLPNNFKWAWAPLLDRFPLPFLGRRRGWMLVCQLGIIVGLGAMATLDADAHLSQLVIVAVFVSIMSMSQDIMIDAYNVEALAPDERAAGSATYVIGYRVAMLTSGALALTLADHIAWQLIYAIMAVLMLVGIGGVFLADEPASTDRSPRTIVESVYKPFLEFWNNYKLHAIVILLFVATYKFGEQFAQSISQPFYRDTGFSKSEIGILSKAVSLPAFIVGGGFGGTLVARYGMRKMLVLFGLLQAAVHVGYLIIASVGHNLPVFGITLFVENVSFAMATAAFTGALYSFCSPAVAATQMALFTSLTGIGQYLFGALSGSLVAAVGYQTFFAITIAMGLPGLALAWFAIAPRGSASAPSTASPA
jgi:MFS transporter, PAT family, beta-lactamase induction signal transducer AmpG